MVLACSDGDAWREGLFVVAVVRACAGLVDQDLLLDDLDDDCVQLFWPFGGLFCSSTEPVCTDEGLVPMVSRTSVLLQDVDRGLHVRQEHHRFEVRLAGLLVAVAQNAPVGTDDRQVALLDRLHNLASVAGRGHDEIDEVARSYFRQHVAKAQRLPNLDRTKDNNRHSLPDQIHTVETKSLFNTPCLLV